MKRYEVQLFNDNMADAIKVNEFDSFIQALECFTAMCKIGREENNLEECHVWLYDQERHCSIIFYSYYHDEKYGTYEELTPCQL